MASETQAVRAARAPARAGQKAQLRERIAQLNEEIAGLTAQEHAKDKEIELIEKELDGVRELYEQEPGARSSRLTALERDAARLEGERGAADRRDARRPRARSPRPSCRSSRSTRICVSEVAKDLREIDGKIGEFVERKVTAEDQLRRIDIRAPQDGIVLQSTVHTVGGVITAGDAIMLIVPEADDLSVEAKVNPQDIDQLQIGQKTAAAASPPSTSAPRRRSTASSPASRPTSPPTSAPARATTPSASRMPPDEVARLGDVKLMPGMPVEAFVQTGDRTVLSYLIKPLQDQLMRAFREK